MAVQKNLRLTQPHAHALASVAKRLSEHPDEIPARLLPHLTEGREVCESEIVGALAAQLAAELGVEPPGPTETDRE